MIILLGYMGSGKSSVGKVLANELGKDFLDFDDHIVAKEGRSIPETFDTKGEIYFRKLEHRLLKELLEEAPDIILSLGGGTPCYSGNMDIIKNYTNNTFYLKTSIPELVARLWDEREKRPLISHITEKDELVEFIGKHLFERSYYYQLAETTIVVDQKSLETISDEIRTVLR